MTTDPTRQWRLITDEAMPGARNMAIDAAIAQAVNEGIVGPTLRLYRWRPYCLSLGMGQAAADADVERLRARGWDLVRRPTGGRAILHADELTYSATLPIDHPLAAGGIVACYRRLSEPLLDAIRRMGAQPHALPKDTAMVTEGGPVCFEVPSHYEITVNGRKIAGSAQMRKSHAVLQHGSIPLQGNLGAICEALAYPDDASRSAAQELVRQRSITVAEALGKPISWEEAAEAVVDGFTSTLGIRFETSVLSAWEKRTADALFAETYSQDAWMTRR
jgi:lipoyl(octanoyl) transferase